MADVQERVAQLEGRVERHAQMLTGVAGAVRHLEARMDQRFASVDLRFTGIENRLTALDHKLDRRTDALTEKLGREVGRLDQKLDRHFRWLVGIQFAMLIALVASFLAG